MATEELKTALVETDVALKVKEAYESNADTNAFTDTEKTKLDDLKTKAELATALGLKVDKVSGKQLSDENLTADEKAKLNKFFVVDSFGNMVLTIDADAGKKPYIELRRDGIVLSQIGLVTPNHDKLIIEQRSNADVEFILPTGQSITAKIGGVFKEFVFKDEISFAKGIVWKDADTANADNDLKTDHTSVLAPLVLKDAQVLPIDPIVAEASKVLITVGNVYKMMDSLRTHLMEDKGDIVNISDITETGIYSGHDIVGFPSTGATTIIATKDSAGNIFYISVDKDAVAQTAYKESGKAIVWATPSSGGGGITNPFRVVAVGTDKAKGSIVGGTGAGAKETLEFLDASDGLEAEIIVTKASLDILAVGDINLSFGAGKNAYIKRGTIKKQIATLDDIPTTAHATTVQIVHHGTTPPLASLGADGDIYFEYPEDTVAKRLFEEGVSVTPDSSTPFETITGLTIDTVPNQSGFLLKISGFSDGEDNFGIAIIVFNTKQEAFLTFVNWDNTVDTNLKGLLGPNAIVKVKGVAVAMPTNIFASDIAIIEIDTTDTTEVTRLPHISVVDTIIDLDKLTIELDLNVSQGEYDIYEKVKGAWVEHRPLTKADLERPYVISPYTTTPVVAELITAMKLLPHYTNDVAFWGTSHDFYVKDDPQTKMLLVKYRGVSTNVSEATAGNFFYEKLTLAI